MRYKLFVLSGMSLMFISGAKADDNDNASNIGQVIDSTLNEDQTPNEGISLREKIKEIAGQDILSEKAQKVIFVATNLARESSTPAQSLRDFIIKNGYNIAEIESIADRLKKLGYTININKEQNQIGIEFVSSMSYSSKDASNTSTRSSTEKLSPKFDEINKKLDELTQKLESNDAKSTEDSKTLKSNEGTLGDIKKGVESNVAANEAILSKVNELDQKIADKVAALEKKVAESGLAGCSCDLSRVNKLSEQIKDMTNQLNDIITVKHDMANVIAELKKVLEERKVELKTEKVPEEAKTDENPTTPVIEANDPKLSVTGNDIKATAVDTTVIDNDMIDSKNEFIIKIFDNLRRLYPNMKDGDIIREICNASLGVSTLKVKANDNKTEFDILRYIKHLAELKNKHKKLPLAGLCKQDLANNRMSLESNGQLLSASVEHFENDANRELYTAWMQGKDLAKIREEAINDLTESARKNKDALDQLYKIFSDYGLIYEDNAALLYEILNLQSEFSSFIDNLRRTYKESDVMKLIEKYVTEEHVSLRIEDNTFERLKGKYDKDDAAYDKFLEKKKKERADELANMKKVGAKKKAEDDRKVKATNNATDKFVKKSKGRQVVNQKKKVR